MRRAVSAAALLALLPAPALAGPHGLSDPARTGAETGVRQLAAAVAPGGAAVVVTTDGTRARVHRRVQAGAPFTTTTAGPAAVARDPQAAAEADGTLTVAWAEVVPGGRGRVVVWRSAGAGWAERSFGVASGAGALPRLAVRGGGATLLAFRDGRTIRAARVAGLVRPRAVAFDASRFDLSAGHLAWVSRPARRRTARVVLLDARARAIEGPYVVSRDAGPRVALAGGAADGRAIASWLRPGGGGREPAAFTRSLWPVARSAQPVRTAGPELHVPEVRLATDGTAVLGVRVLRRHGEQVASLASRAGGRWTTLRAHGAAQAGLGAPRVLGGGLLLWLRARAAPGPAAFDVVVARRAPDGPGGDPEVLGDAGAARTLVVAEGDGRALVAWPAPGGGVAVAERG